MTDSHDNQPGRRDFFRTAGTVAAGAAAVAMTESQIQAATLAEIEHWRGQVGSMFSLGEFDAELVSVDVREQPGAPVRSHSAMR